MSDQQPAPKKKHTFRNIMIAILVVGGLMIAGCVALIGGAANEIDKQSKDESTVVYTLTGTAKKVDVTYTTDGSTSTSQENGQKLPWTKTIKVKGLMKIYQVMGQNTGPRGTVKCEIKVDGKVLKTGQSKGGYAIASCDATE